MDNVQQEKKAPCFLLKCLFIVIVDVESVAVYGKWIVIGTTALLVILGLFKKAV